MGNADKLIGGAMLLVAATVFTFYTTWTLLTPFFPSDHPIQSFFPHREWAVRLPAAFLVVGAAGVGCMTGLVLVKQARKDKAKRSGKSA